RRPPGGSRKTARPRRMRPSAARPWKTPKPPEAMEDARCAGHVPAVGAGSADTVVLVAGTALTAPVLIRLRFADHAVGVVPALRAAAVAQQAAQGVGAAGSADSVAIWV